MLSSFIAGHGYYLTKLTDTTLQYAAVVYWILIGWWVVLVGWTITRIVLPSTASDYDGLVFGIVLLVSGLTAFVVFAYWAIRARRELARHLPSVDMDPTTSPHGS
ncbi:MAG: hypothetical protein OXG08_04735 [Gammaproteobacteria bacterium]|nr:hypothetical protein [Gammaproteobacteria bacterium]